jgi:hypothetical protein
MPRFRREQWFAQVRGAKFAAASTFVVSTASGDRVLLLTSLSD